MTKLLKSGNRTVRLKSGTTIWIYATQPVARIVAKAKIRTVFHGVPAEIWVRYGEKLCLEKPQFDLYIGNSSQITALVLWSVKEVKDLFSLENIREVVENFHPPQFYSYLPSDNQLLGTLNRLEITSVSLPGRSSG